jgi:uncharacterized membrane protein YgaE (UPF0421/DUF939 family)
LQAAICAVLIVKGYDFARASGAMWALVSAALVLQPGFSQSLAASAIRVVANLLGAGIGAAISLTLGARLPEICLGLVAIILICEFARLDKGVRSACASVLIVMMKTDDTVLHRSLERVTAVAVGCGIALLLQIITQPIIAKIKIKIKAERSQAQHAGEE